MPARRSVLIGFALLLSATLAVVGGLIAVRGVRQTPHHAALRLGLAGPYTSASLAQARTVGVTATLVEMSWAMAEPHPGQFDLRYLDGVREQAQELHDQRFQIALNTGLQNAPGWVLDQPGGRFVDQYGAAYVAAPVPNLVFDVALRAYAQVYLDRVMSMLGSLTSLVRAGGGFFGELSYPYEFAAGGHIRNLYWAYDVDAAAQNPVPGWHPGDASPRNQAAVFLTWYLNALVRYQNWQVAALRAAGWPGSIAMLYPSSGMRPGDSHTAVGDNLNGASSAEINGEVQRGYDFARQIDSLSDPRVVVYGTWGDNLAVVNYLATLAAAHGNVVMAENGGGNNESDIDAALGNAAALHLAAFFLIRASDLTCACANQATLTQIGKFYRTLPAG